MKKYPFLLAVVAGATLAGSVFAGQMMPGSMGYGGYHNGGYGNNGVSRWHGGNGQHNHGRVIADPKNPASVRNWAHPQASSVYCLGAGCTLHYPTPRQQFRSGGTQVCNNSGCHPGYRRW
jgi:hypothetical protein